MCRIETEFILVINSYFYFHYSMNNRVRKFRHEANNGGTPVLYLNAGDTYTGTPWFTVFKDNITAAFLNKLEPDAIVSSGSKVNLQF